MQREKTNQHTCSCNCCHDRAHPGVLLADRMGQQAVGGTCRQVHEVALGLRKVEVHVHDDTPRTLLLKVVAGTDDHCVCNTVTSGKSDTL
jgi:cytochrome c peroxidase